MAKKNTYTTILAPLVIIALAIILLVFGQKTEKVPEVTEETVVESAQQSNTFDIPSNLPIDGELEESYRTGGNDSIVQVMVYHSPLAVSDVADMYTTYYQENGYTLIESEQDNGVLTFLGVNRGTKMSVVGYQNGDATLVEVSLTWRE